MSGIILVKEDIMLASLININKFYNGNQVLKNISLTIDESDKIGLVGNNGCGKSTLLKILTGSVEPDRFTEKDGIISLAAKTTIGYLEQMGGLDSENTVMEEMNIPTEINAAPNSVAPKMLPMTSGHDGDAKKQNTTA